MSDEGTTMGTCPKCGHDLHDGACQAWTYLGGDPPIHKSCACMPEPEPPVLGPDEE